MNENLLEYLTVYLSSAIRFVLGPTLGTGYQLGILVTTALTTLGMMTTVYLFSYFHAPIHRLTVKLIGGKERKLFTPRNRKFVKIWKTYGLKGVAFITPTVLSPVLGAILVNAVGGNRREAIKWMWISAFMWALIESTILHYAGNVIREYLDF